MLPSQFLIGVDSDGTAFDSMNIKHLEAFIPAALEIWPMPEKMAERFSEIEKKVNLFSATRGINRYPGLLMAFEQLAELYPKEDSLPNLTDLREYIAGESKYSPTTLCRWLAEHPSGELEKVLAWSDRADELFSHACEGLLPYPGVLEALTQAHEISAIAVVSSAAKAGLEKDWKAGGLIPFVDLLMSQEDGSKAMQLQKAISQCGEHVTALMIGDTDSDGISAHEAGTWFYPIIPGKEAGSWKRLKEEVLPQFFAGKYDAAEEAKYYDQLKRELAST